MSVRLVILGWLRERDLYGYEIKQIIEKTMDDWTSIAFGSIYFALNKLCEEGLIEKANVEQEGGRPSRTVYRITDAGRDEFLVLLRKVWQSEHRMYFDLDIGIFFMQALPPGEVEAYLRERVTELENTLAEVKEHRAEQLNSEYVPRLAGAIFDHSLIHMEAELTWTRDFLAAIERGDYP